MTNKTRISVYLDTGVVREYFVDGAVKGREHAAAIIKSGYRATDGEDLAWFPPHRIEKVKVEGGVESPEYQDEARPT